MTLEDLGRRMRRARRDRRRREGGEESADDPTTGELPSEPRAADPSSRTRDLFRQDSSTRAEIGDEEADLRLVDLDPAAAHRLQNLEIENPELAARFAALDPEQAAAVLAADRASLVEAQVGSGKTRVLVDKVLALCLVDGVSLSRIAVLTFTRKAAAEIVERLQAALGRTASPDELRFIGTFHSVARSLLEDSGRLDLLQRRPGFRILDSGARTATLQRLIADEKLRVCYPNRLDRRLRAAREGKILFGSMKREDDIRQLGERYEDLKRRENLFDFDDLISGVLAVAPALDSERRPAWILVDELQDSSPDQMAMIETWAGPETGHFAVGDPRQVIYSWRGSASDVFATYRRRFAARDHLLARNHRSRASILAVAGAVLGAGAGRLRAARRGGETVVVRKHHDVLQECAYLAGRLHELQGEGIALEDVAVLVRTREQRAAMAKALVDAGIEVFLPEGQGHPRADWFDWLALVLRAVCRGDPAALRQLDRDPRRGSQAKKGRARGRLWEEIPLETLESLGAKPGASPEDWMRALDIERRLRPTRSEYPRELAATRRALGAFLEGACDPAALEARRRDLESRGAWAELLRSGAGRETGEKAGGLRLLTMHAAKGLEFEVVFVSGVNEGVLPLAGAASAEARLEERRLLFVALTRARERAEISWHGQPLVPRAEGRASSFLDLVPHAILDRRDLPAEAQKIAVGGDRRERKEASSSRRRETGAPWKVGMQVRHRDYGVGVIESLDESQLTCEFPRRGRKTFSLYFCPLEIVTEEER
jgi:ATP-dependent DNA helicase UvrD/PcrA